MMFKFANNRCEEGVPEMFGGIKQECIGGVLTTSEVLRIIRDRGLVYPIHTNNGGRILTKDGNYLVWFKI